MNANRDNVPPHPALPAADPDDAQAQLQNIIIANAFQQNPQLRDVVADLIRNRDLDNALVAFEQRCGAEQEESETA
jgi:hypothetical protein